MNVLTVKKPMKLILLSRVVYVRECLSMNYFAVSQACSLCLHTQPRLRARAHTSQEVCTEHRPMGNFTRERGEPTRASFYNTQTYREGQLCIQYLFNFVRFCTKQEKYSTALYHKLKTQITIYNYKKLGVCDYLV